MPTTCELHKLIGKKWTFQIISEIASSEFVGFNSFRKKIGSITPKILSAYIKDLESTGIISKKTLVVESRATSRYELTKKGKELHRLISKIRNL